MKYKRALLKISGEALAGAEGHGFDMDFVTKVCRQLKQSAEQGAQIGVVIGGGNFWRGVKDGAGKISRVSADRMGMLSTCMNCLAVADVLRKLGAKVKVMTAFDVTGVGEHYDPIKADEYLADGNIVLFAGGTGAPYVSTDSAAALRAAEIGADIMLLAKNIDGVYTADPAKDPTAKKLEKLSYEDMIDQKLGVMDLTAATMAMENHIPAMVFAIADPENIQKGLDGEPVGTILE